MSEPEIARRCSSCGASIRDAASFCPQCGKKLSQTDSSDSKQKYSALTAPLIEASAEKPPVKAEKSADPTQPLTEPPPPPRKAVEPMESKKTPGGPATVGKVRGGIQRATTLARDVEGDVIHRVQKVREISSVVLDEAGYDPSLRFVLVACALFIVFLIIALLNKFIK